MEQSDFIKRITDLRERAEKTASVTHSSFLTPAEQMYVEQIAQQNNGDVSVILFGGADFCERKMAFFLPYYITSEDFLETEKEDAECNEYLTAIRIKSYFGQPEHRDYLGAVLALGIERDRIGDVVVLDDTAYVFCVRSVAGLILNELEKVGRCGIKTFEVGLAQVPAPVRQIKTMTFTVKSLRLDAVAGEIFGISRTQTAELIRLGLVSLNYNVCVKTDAQINEGDVISIRGKGKGCVKEVGGKSRKDRLFIIAEKYI